MENRNARYSHHKRPESQVLSQKISGRFRHSHEMPSPDSVSPLFSNDMTINDFYNPDDNFRKFSKKFHRKVIFPTNFAKKSRTITFKYFKNLKRSESLEFYVFAKLNFCTKFQLILKTKIQLIDCVWNLGDIMNESSIWYIFIKILILGVCMNFRR